MLMADRFAGRTAIVTGAGVGGLGAAYAEALAAGSAGWWWPTFARRRP